MVRCSVGRAGWMLVASVGLQIVLKVTSETMKPFWWQVCARVCVGVCKWMRSGTMQCGESGVDVGGVRGAADRPEGEDGDDEAFLAQVCARVCVGVCKRIWSGTMQCGDSGVASGGVEGAADHSEGQVGDFEASWRQQRK